MKTNFKKLAIQAGVSAALATGSMAASAQIEAVPATAQLVPLFYYSTAAGIDTNVQVVVPKSVGADTVIDLLDGGVNPSSTWAVSNPALVGGQLHWFWMNAKSVEILNGTESVSPDDELTISAQDVDTRIGSNLNNGSAGYLIIVNETAAYGGAPTFQFAAEAFLEDTTPSGNLSLPGQISIPVLGMNDAADAGGQFPTPGNQVIESGAVMANGPDASPLYTGIRTSTTAAGANFRVVDVPMYPAGVATTGTVGQHNVIVAWSDRNNAASLTIPTLYSVDQNEQQFSFPGIDLNNELNFVVVPSAADDRVWGTYGLAGLLGINDTYTNLLTTTGGSPAVLTSGFLKLVMPAETLPVGAGLLPGAYSSVVIFNIPVAAQITSAPTYSDTAAPVTAIDTGFFTSAQ